MKQLLTYIFIVYYGVGLGTSGAVHAQPAAHNGSHAERSEVALASASSSGSLGGHGSSGQTSNEQVLGGEQPISKKDDAGERENLKDALGARDLKGGSVALGIDESIAKYERKSISYLRAEKAVPVPADAYEIIVRELRRNVELPRFDYNDVSHLEKLSPDDAAQAVKVFLDEIKLDRARAGADYDLRFKDYQITGADLRRIAESAYLYQPVIEDFKVRQEQYVIYTKAGPRVVNRWVADLGVSIRFYAVDFTAGTASELAMVQATASGSELELGISSRTSAIRAAAANVGQELEKQVRGVREFNLLTPVRVADFNSVTFDLTRKEGLKLDQGFYVYDYYTDGSRKRAGYVKVKRVGNGKTVLDSDARNITVYNGWSFEEGQLLEEYPQTGIRFEPRIGYQNYSLIEDPALGVDGSTGGMRFELGAQYDIAEQLGISEIYASGALSLTLGGLLEVGVEAGLDKRFYLRRLVLVPGVSIGYLRSYFSVDKVFRGNDTGFYYGESVGVTPRLGAELFLSPDFSIGFRAAHRFYTPQRTFTLMGDGDKHMTPADEGGSMQYDPSGWEFSGGISLSF